MGCLRNATEHPIEHSIEDAFEDFIASVWPMRSLGVS